MARPPKRQAPARRPGSPCARRPRQSGGQSAAAPSAGRSSSQPDLPAEPGRPSIRTASRPRRSPAAAASEGAGTRAVAGPGAVVRTGRGSGPSRVRDSQGTPGSGRARSRRAPELPPVSHGPPVAPSFGVRDAPELVEPAPRTPCPSITQFPQRSVRGRMMQQRAFARIPAAGSGAPAADGGEPGAEVALVPRPRPSPDPCGPGPAFRAARASRFRTRRPRRRRGQRPGTVCPASLRRQPRQVTDGRPQVARRPCSRCCTLAQMCRRRQRCRRRQ